MAKNEKVGKAIATAYMKDERDIPDYEFPDSGHVKLNLTTSDVAVLEEAASEPDMQSKSSTSLADILLLNCFVWHAVRNAETEQILLGILTFVVGMSTRDWYRLHGEKLTRALKAILNVSNMLNSFDATTFDFFGICKCFKFNGKYIFFPEDLKINEGIPRTPETSPPLSPSSGERGEIRNSAITKS
uniref:Uncharacterized protein n=1 Tax=Wuchereria bancrofti TaxID=6293 RepID=A0A1I8ELR6_WUCBA